AAYRSPRSTTRPGRRRGPRPKAQESCAPRLEMPMDERTRTSVSTKGAPKPWEKRLEAPGRLMLDIRSQSKRIRRCWNSNTSVLLPGRYKLFGAPFERNCPILGTEGES